MIHHHFTTRLSRAFLLVSRSNVEGALSVDSVHCGVLWSSNQGIDTTDTTDK